MSDTALAPVVRPTTFSLAPSNLAEAMEFAKLIANSDLAPKDFRGKPGNVLIAVQMGAEVGLSPMAAVQNIAVINGKPGVYGDAGKALLLAAGCVIEEDDIEIVKKNGRGRCKITRPGRPPVERTFSVEDAKTARLWGKEGPWSTYPSRQLAWRAFWYAARDAASDILKGLRGAEEISDYEVMAEAPAQPALRAPQRKSALPPAPAAVEASATPTEAPGAAADEAEATAPPTVETVATITPAQWEAMRAKAKQRKFTDAQFKAWLDGMNIHHGSDIRADEYDDLMAALDAGPRS